MKFNDEQKELIALLPSDAKKYGLTDSAKLVWAQIIFMYGMDFATENGFVFRSNEDLLKDTGIASKSTLLNAINQLVSKGLISTKRAAKGDRGTASEYVLNESVLQNCTINCTNGNQNCTNNCTIQDIDNQAFNKNCTINCTKKCTIGNQNCTIENEKCTIEIERKINDMELNIKELVEVINDLKNEIKELKCTIETQNCTTDTDTETEKESDQEIDDRSMNEKNKLEVNTPIAETKNQSGIAQSPRIVSNSNFVDIADAYGEALDNLEFGVPIAENKSNISSCKPQRIDSTSKNEINEKFSRLIEDIKDLNVVYSAATTKEAIDGYYQEAVNLTSKFNEMADKLTDRQLAYGQSLLEKTVAICGRKDNYLAAIAKSITNTDIVQTNNQASDVYTDDEWTTKVEQSFNAEETTKDNSSDSSNEEVKTQKSEEEELNDHMLKMFAELDEQDKAVENKVLSTLSWDTLPF